ncbi:uncharacterized protein LOC143465408 [Clavelina lepadiformis]|uniref:uncharacterized protein LOC143465408 n=1 Tax=Clavelina lepadiformis TaxID=159417 RepID=UPI00404348FE
MKLLVLLSLIAVCYCQKSTTANLLQSAIRNHLTGQLYLPGTPRACQKNCNDQNKFCGTPQMRLFCNQTNFLGIIIKSKCPRACKVCKPCNGISARTCLPDKNCRDSHKLCSTFLAPKLCKDEKVGYLVSQKCKKSCGICMSCEGLTPVPDCSRDCKDAHKSCPDWAHDFDYCINESIHHEWMMINCKLSCRICKPCGGIPPPKPTFKPIAPTFPSTTTFRPPLRRCDRGRTVGVSVRDQCLNTHNYYRCLHGLQPLRYDFILESSAQAYANKLATFQSSGPSRLGIDRARDVGENIAEKASNIFTVNDAVTGWYATGLGFDYHSGSLSKETGTFTQVIWKETSSVGCALRRLGSETFVVAHYRRAGNEELTFFSNIQEPTRDVCEAMCGSSACQGHDGSRSKCDCERSGSREDVPVCEGRCVVSCPRPRNYSEQEWEESCEGVRECRCVTSSSRFGDRIGATCI